jgi:hypothetical protein
MLTLARARAEEGVALGRFLSQVDTILALPAQSVTPEEIARLRAYRTEYAKASELLDEVIKRVSPAPPGD